MRVISHVLRVFMMYMYILCILRVLYSVYMYIDILDIGRWIDHDLSILVTHDQAYYNGVGYISMNHH